MGKLALQQKIEQVFGPDWSSHGSEGNRFLYGTYDAIGVRVTLDGVRGDVSAFRWLA